jgi:transposase
MGRQLNHSDRAAEKFYREPAAPGFSIRVGMEATSHSSWFERLLAELGIEVWIGGCGGDQDQASPQAEAGP